VSAKLQESRQTMNSLDGRRGNTVSPGDLADALAIQPVLLDSGVVQFQRLAADVLTFQASAPHAATHPLNDQAAFEFSDSADDGYDGAAQRAASVDVFPEADILDS
jgi:hypothetical protein